MTNRTEAQPTTRYTIAESGDAAVLVPLESGVRLRGRGYEVTDGTGPERMTAVFDDPLTANACKRYWRRCREADIIRPAADTFRAVWNGGDAPLPHEGAVPAPDPITLGEMITLELKRVNAGLGKGLEKRRYRLGRLRAWGQDNNHLDTTLDQLADNDAGDDLVQWLFKGNYEPTTASQIIGEGRYCAKRMIKRDRATKNAFEDLHMYRRSELPPVNRRGRRRATSDVTPFTPAEVAAVGATLPERYRTPYWIAVATAVRRSELFGLRVRDWDWARKGFHINGQRQASPTKGYSEPKTENGVRFVPVTALPASLVERHIVEHHGPPPTDPVERLPWGDRYLLVGAKGGPMNQQTFVNHLTRAYATLGIDLPRVEGNLKPLHHLRTTVVSWLTMMPQMKPYMAIISEVVGHDLPDGLSKTTKKFYRKFTLEELEPFRDAMAEKFEEITAALGTDDLLAGLHVADPCGVTEAAALLGVGEAEIKNLAANGALRAIIAAGARDRLVLDRAEVIELARASRQEMLDTYSAAEVTELLGIDRLKLFSMRDNRTLTDLGCNPRRRINGGPGMSMAGGGYRFLRSEVDALVEADADRLQRRQEWLTTGETADRLGLSPDTVRRMADRGELEVWVDPRSYRKERFISPASVQHYIDNHEAMTAKQAAEYLGTTTRSVRAFKKLGILRNARVASNNRVVRGVLCSDVLKLASEQSDAA